MDAEKDDDADAVGGGANEGGEAVVTGKKPYGTALDELDGLRLCDTLRLWCGDVG